MAKRPMIDGVRPAVASPPKPTDPLLFDLFGGFQPSANSTPVTVPGYATGPSAFFRAGPTNAVEAGRQIAQQVAQQAGPLGGGQASGFGGPLNLGQGISSISQLARDRFTGGFGASRLNLGPGITSISQLAPDRFAQGDAGAESEGLALGAQGTSGPGGGNQPDASAGLLTRLSGLVDPAVLGPFLQSITAAGFTIASVDQLEDGTVIVMDNEGNPYTLAGRVAEGRNPFETERLRIDQEKNKADQDFLNRQLETQERIADNQAQVDRDRIAADRFIAQGNWDNALKVQDRIDAREKESRELQRELQREQIAHDQQRVELERQKFDLDRLQFLSTLQAMNPIDFMNISRGLPPTAAGGPLPGGLQRVGPLNPLAASLAGGSAASGQGQAAPSQLGQPAPAGFLPSMADQSELALPPAIADVQAGRTPTQPLSLPEGSVRVPSAQQLSRFSPAEQQFLASLVQAQGLNLEDFNRFVAERRPSQRRGTARIQ